MQPLVGKRTDYRIHMEYPSTNSQGWQTVTGCKVVIPGFEEFDFFVHRGTERRLLTENPWRISEVSTGGAMPRETDGHTRQEAINKVTQFLTLKGKDKLVKVIDRVTQDSTVA